MIIFEILQNVFKYNTKKHLPWKVEEMSSRKENHLQILQSNVANVAAPVTSSVGWQKLASEL